MPVYQITLRRAGEDAPPTWTIDIEADDQFAAEDIARAWFEGAEVIEVGLVNDPGLEPEED